MIRPAQTFVLSCLLAFGLTACQQQPPRPTASTPTSRAAAAPSLPGAQTRGGLDGRVIKVSTLAADGPGSLREALATPGARVIVFEVGGVIDLARQDLVLGEPFVSIAGQTAPAPGITLIRGGMKIRTHDVVMQHLRWRMGEAGQARRSGYESDISVEGAAARNVHVDHCSIAWGTDENLSVSGPRYAGPDGTAGAVTFSNNIIAEGLVNSTHAKGAHSMGTLVHDNVRNVLIRGNLYIHNADRNPWFKGGSSGVIANNLIYNPGIWAIRLGYNPKEWQGRTAPPAPRVAIVGNLMQSGADTPGRLSMIGSNAPDRQGDAWVHDNLALNRMGQPVTLLSGGITALAESPQPLPQGLLPASQVRDAVLAHAGARPAERDNVDQRLVREVRQRTGRQIDSQNEVGGYPEAAPTRRTLNPPAQGLDTWLEGFSRVVEGR